MITTVNELSGALYNVVPTAAALGVSFEDVSASLATMTAAGTPTSVATTQLRSAMNELSKSGTKASIAFEEMSGKTFKEFAESGGNMAEAMAIMEEAAAKNDVAITDMFSSVEAGAAALALTGTGAEKYNSSLTAMQESAGATDKAYQTMSEGVNASFERIMTAMKNTMITLGDKLAPLVMQVADWIETNMPIIQKFVFDAFTKIGEVIEVAIQIIKDFYNKYKGVFDGIIEMLKAFVGMFQRIWEKYGNSITATIKATWELVKNIFSGAMDILGGLIEVFTNLFEGDFEGMKEAVTDLVDKMWESVKQLFSSFIDWMKNLIPTMFNIGKDLFNGLWNGIKSIWEGISDWITGKVDWMMDKLTFWDNGKKKMDGADGSHATGLLNVPFDGYKAILHSGERVLTANEALLYNQGQNTTLNVDNSQLVDLLKSLNDKLDRLPSNFRNEERLGYIRG